MTNSVLNLMKNQTKQIIEGIFGLFLSSVNVIIRLTLVKVITLSGFYRKMVRSFVVRVKKISEFVKHWYRCKIETYEFNQNSFSN